MAVRDVEFCIAYVEYIYPLGEQGLGFVCHLNGCAYSGSLSLGQGIGTVQAVPRATAFGLQADLSTRLEVAAIIDQVAACGNGYVLGPGRGIGPKRVLCSPQQSGNRVKTPFSS